MFKGQPIIWEDAESLSEAAAYFFIQRCAESIADHGYFAVALSGGSTPKRLFQLLAAPPFVSTIPWNKVFLFWGDERFVPQDHEDSNYRMTKETLLDHIDIPSKNIFPVPVKGKPAACAAKYEQQIKKFFKDKPVFDLVMLGMGDDGHTASLFPGTSILEEKKKWISEVWVENKQTFRISFTYRLINKASHVLLLVAGEAKAKVISDIKTGKKDIYPVQGVEPKKGTVIWMLDKKAVNLIM